MRYLFTSLVVIFLVIIFFLALELFFPSSGLSTHGVYLYLGNISTKLLIALILSILLCNASGRLATLLLGSATGTVFFLNILGLKIVDPTQISWLMRGDWHFNFLGWHFFRGEPWHFPLGKITDFFYPVGTSIGYTDSIPLMAFLLKPFHSILPADFQYLGLWLLLCFVLQGIFGLLLLKLVTTNRFLQWMGATFFVVSPILLHRIGHVALCAHWLLLAGLWLYFKPWQPVSSYRPFISWALLVGTSALIHPYLTVMVLGLALAFYVCWGLVERHSSLYAMAGQLGCLGLLVLGLWWQAGYFLIDNEQMVARTLGHYSMNLLAFINPWGDWSLLLRNLPLATDGQYEGFGYLGAGIILLGSWVGYELILRPIGPLNIRKTLPLFIVVIIALLFAVSPKVTIGAWVLFEGNNAWLSILAPFQSSGRFLWLAYYLIVFGVLGILVRRLSAPKALLLLSFGLAIQFADLQGIHRYHHQRWQENTDWQIWDNPLKAEVWSFATSHYQHITFVPPIACGEPPASQLPFAYLAASYGLTLNTGRAARFDAEKTMRYCQTLLTEIQQGQVKDDTIYLIHQDRLTAFKQATREPLACAKIDGFNICVTMDSYLHWQQFIQKSMH